MLGPAADFRDGQWEAVDLVANQRRRVLVVQRTGWGKSIVYFLATRILRDAGAGPTLLISPLLSRMRNQILAAEKLGIRAATIHSQNIEQWRQVKAGLASNQCDVLLVSPERLGNTEFLAELLPLVQAQLGLFVVDEAHCISDWGHDFRPDYRRIVRILRLLPANVPALCTTATANNRVVQDVQAQIPHLRVLRGPLVRTSLRLFNLLLQDQASRLAWLAHFVPQLPGNGIIYCLTIQDTRRVAEWLQKNGVNARPYHADLQAQERIAAERALLANEVKTLVATIALGMGFDKPDLGFVIHFQRPGSVVAYYQQVGRAGRAVDEAYGILMSGREEDEIQDYFIRTAFPPAELMKEVLQVLEGHTNLTLEGICAELNYPRGTLEKALKLLEVDGAVQHEGTRFARTANRWKPDVLQAKQVTAIRRAEGEQMRDYLAHTGCLMEFLARALDDPTAGPCGKCMNCTGRTQRRAVPAALVAAAVAYLRSDVIVLPVRRRWPKPVADEVRASLPGSADLFPEGHAKSVIPESARAQEGRALCIWGDAGWGREVAAGKYEAGRFSEALVEAAAKLVRHQWQPQPWPEWVTAVPSRRRQELVRDFAQRLAGRLQLPFLPLLRKPADTPPQKEMENSVSQIRNLLGAFGLEAVPPKGPVLLVDDLVDSGWTMTVLAVLLQHHGAGPVFPLALAKATPRGGS
jgi:ATP-dependent DNA helicase RecQ